MAAPAFVEAPLNSFLNKAFAHPKGQANGKVIINMIHDTQGKKSDGAAEAAKRLPPGWEKDQKGAYMVTPPLVRIHNARRAQARAGSPKEFFDQHGFVLLKHQTHVKDWAAPEQIELYAKEVEQLLRHMLVPDRGAELVFPPGVLRRGPDWGKGPSIAPFYAYGVHADNALDADDFERNHACYDPADARRWRAAFDRPAVGGGASYTFWRPAGMRAPLKTAPLAVLDPSSVDYDDLVSVGVAGFSPTGEITTQLGLRYDPRQMWYYYPDMTCDEVLVFKQFEYFKGSGGSLPFRAPLRQCFHSAFADPTTPRGAEPRRSVEYRVRVFFPSKKGPARL